MKDILIFFICILASGWSVFFWYNNIRLDERTHEQKQEDTYYKCVLNKYISDEEIKECDKIK